MDTIKLNTNANFKNYVVSWISNSEVHNRLLNRNLDRFYILLYTATSFHYNSVAL